jgi:hypothetical protein
MDHDLRVLFLYAPENEIILELGKVMEFSRTKWPLYRTLELLDFLEKVTHGFRDLLRLEQELVKFYDKMDDRSSNFFDNPGPTMSQDDNWSWARVLREASKALETESVLMLNGRVSLSHGHLITSLLYFF